MQYYYNDELISIFGIPINIHVLLIKSNWIVSNMYYLLTTQKLFMSMEFMEPLTSIELPEF